MVITLLCGFVAVVLVMILFLQYAEPSIPIKAVRKFFAKEIIIAMSQQSSAVAEPTPKYEDDVQWVRRFVSNSCAALDFVPYGLKLLELIDGFCKQIENVLDVFEANLLEYDTRLSAIREARQSVEKELAKQLESTAKSTERFDCVERNITIAVDRLGQDQHNPSPLPVPRHVAIEFCVDADDDECLMNAFSQLMYPQQVDDHECHA